MTTVEFGARRTIVVFAVMLATLLQLADTTIVNVAIPTIDGNLGASLDEGTWFITAYIVANVVVLPLAPFFQTLLGRKRYFALSIAGFTLASIACGMANDVGSEIASRFVQGAFGGGLMVSAQQILRDTFPPQQLGTSQGLFGLAAVIGPTIGPTLGGALTDAGSWRSVFFINVIPGFVALTLVLAYLRDPERAERTPIDGIGIAALALGLGSLQFVLEEGERRDWFADPAVGVAAVAAVAGLAFFAVWELRVARTPAVALAVLRRRAVWATAVVSFVVGFGLYGIFVIQPQYTQSVLGFTTTLTGLMVMVRAGTVLLFFPLTMWIVSRPGLDVRPFVAAGLAVFALSCWLQADLTVPDAVFATFLATQALGGIAYALLFTPINVALLRAIPPAAVAPSLALTRLAQQIGGSIGTALLVTGFDRAYAAHQAVLRDAASLARPAVFALVTAHPHDAIPLLARVVSQQAATLADADALRTIALVTLAAVPLPFVLARAPRAS